MSPQNRIPTSTSAKALWWGALLLIVALFLWAGVYKVYLASLGQEGIDEQNLINAVQESLKNRLLVIDPIVFLYLVGAIEITLALGAGLLRRFRRLALYATAAYVVLLSILSVIAHPSLVGELRCNCWGTRLLDFDHMWQILLRNAALASICVWLAGAAHARGEVKKEAQDSAK